MQYAVRDEVVVPGGPSLTLGEQWNTNPRPGHWYGASTEFALEHLGAGGGRSCLVIGSPMFEATALSGQGWDVTYMDVRIPTAQPAKFIQCDATAIPLPDESFDAVSSACVLTHAGTGRYGDSMNLEHGDEMMLSHIVRILKVGSVAALTFGACASVGKMVRMAAHRIYTVAECERMLAAAGLELLAKRIWGAEARQWLALEDPPTTNLDRPDYISFAVRKCGS